MSFCTAMDLKWMCKMFTLTFMSILVEPEACSFNRLTNFNSSSSSCSSSLAT